MEFSAPSLTVEGLRRACETALSRCGLDWQDIGCVVWAPQGNRQDLKVLQVCEALFGTSFAQLPLVTTTEYLPPLSPITVAGVV